MHPVRTELPSRFNTTARILHWLMALMILAMLFIGVGMMGSVNHRLWLISLHRPLGIAILLLAILRLFNRLLCPVSALPASVPRWQARIASASHVLLYALMLILPLIGWSMLSAGGYPITLIRGFNLPSVMPVNPVLYAWLRDSHACLAWLMFALILGHLAAALTHAWIHRDGVFSGMARGQSKQVQSNVPPK